MFAKAFWINLFERAVSTFAQAAIGVLSVGSVGLLKANLVDVVSVAGLAAVLSALKTFSVVAAGPAPGLVTTSIEPVLPIIRAVASAVTPPVTVPPPVTVTPVAATI